MRSCVMCRIRILQEGGGGGTGGSMPLTELLSHPPGWCVLVTAMVETNVSSNGESEDKQYTNEQTAK